MTTSPPMTHPDTAAEVKAHLERLGLSQKALADRLGVHALTVSRWATGTTRPDAHTLRALARMRPQVTVNANDLETILTWWDSFIPETEPRPVAAAFKRLRAATKRSTG